jgi:RNA polymerase sigma-70 factor (ECF subfamily)
MLTTSSSLLERLRRPDDAAAWERFVSLYTPLLLALGRRLGLAAPDAEDLAQDVFARLVTGFATYARDGRHPFRAWLKTVALNTWRDRLRKRPPDGAPLPDVPAPEAGFDFIDREHDRQLARRALQIMQSDFEPATWRACWETAVEGRPAAEVGRELGMSAAAVYVARSRVLRRLREELDGMLG